VDEGGKLPGFIIATELQKILLFYKTNKKAMQNKKLVCPWNNRCLFPTQDMIIFLLMNPRQMIYYVSLFITDRCHDSVITLF